MDTPVDQLTAEFGAHLARYRIARHLKQAELAEAAGINRTTLSRLEQGRGTLDTLARVLIALDLCPRLLNLVPDATIDPLDPLAGRGKQRKRVRDSASEPDDAPWTWRDEPT